jgi:VIT1/CCC1 family predicted Fe2+/Mn2+ transporter
MLISIIVALVLAGLALWALGQFPLDATIARLIRESFRSKILTCVILIPEVS